MSDGEYDEDEQGKLEDYQDLNPNQADVLDSVYDPTA